MATLTKYGRCAYYGTAADALNIETIFSTIGPDVDAIKRLRTYTAGKNATIYEKEVEAEPTLRNPGSRIACPYGEKIVRSIYGYLFSRDYTAAGTDEQEQAAIDAVNAYRQPIRSACRDMLETGMGRLLVSGSVTAPEVTALDPARTVDIIDAFGNRVAVVVATGENQNSQVARLDVYTAEAHTVVTRSGLEETKHGLGVIPVVTFDAIDRRACFESVVSLIDGHDLLFSQAVDEVLRWAFSILVTQGRQMPADALDGKPGTIRLLHLEEGDKVEYLTRNLSIDLWREAVTRCGELIHTLTDVPDFASPTFAALSGVALEYKLIGFETVCGNYAREAESSILELAALIRGKTSVGIAASIVPVSGRIDFPRLKPADELYTTQVAQGMKAAGLSTVAITERLAGLLPESDSEDKGAVEAELDRQKEEAAGIAAELDAAMNGRTDSATNGPA